MFEIRNENTGRPIKVWLNDMDCLEDKCLEQAYHLSQLPFVHQWVCLMPDTHAGKGMPIGGVFAAKDVVIPNAVGTDIGCGMVFTATNVKVADIREIQTGNGTVIQSVIGDLMREIPAGRTKYHKPQPCRTLDAAKDNGFLSGKDTELIEALEEGYYQIGTLGGGNHFIELQEDEEGYLCIMIHSGSRYLGACICGHFNAAARENVAKWGSTIPEEYKLDYLPTDTDEGRQYLDWMELAMDYAYENRAKMMEAAKNAVKAKVEKFTDYRVEYTDDINCHHNYASLEEHYGEEVWVHRKGATRVRTGERAVIPGAMSSYSYVVIGKGNAESFDTSSHGAGRRHSRTAAMEKFTTEQVIVDLKQQGVILGKRKKNDVAEECRFAYKDIDEVMAQQKDMVEIVRKLHTVGVIKG